MIKIGLRMPKMIHIGAEGPGGRDYIYNYSPEEVRLINKLDRFLAAACAKLEIPDAYILEQFTREDLDYGRVPFSFILYDKRSGRRANLEDQREVAHVQKLFKSKEYDVKVSHREGRVCFILQMPPNLFLAQEEPVEIDPPIGNMFSSEGVVAQQLALRKGFNDLIKRSLCDLSDQSSHESPAWPLLEDLPKEEN